MVILQGHPPWSSSGRSYKTYLATKYRRNEKQIIITERHIVNRFTGSMKLEAEKSYKLKAENCEKSLITNSHAEKTKTRASGKKKESPREKKIR